MRLLPLLALAACAVVPERPPPPAARSGLPDGFAVRGKPAVEAPYLDAAATWRLLRSRLRTLRAEARSGGEDLLVSFEENSFRVTDRQGRQRAWTLPEGLAFAGGRVHLLLRADLTCALFDGAGAQVPPAEELTATTVRIGPAGAPEEEIRLVIKGGRHIRSISTAG